MERTELQQILDMAESGIFTTKQDTEMQLIYANARFYEILHYTPEEFQEEFGGKLLAAVLPEDKQKIRNLIARQRAAGGKVQLEFRAKLKNGLVSWISLSAKSVMTDGGMVYCCSCMDITHTKRILAEVYQAKLEADLIANSIPGGVVKLRMTDFKLLYANEGFFRLAGFSKEEYYENFGNHVNQVLHPDDQQMVQNQVKAAINNHGVLGFEYRIISKAGDVRWSYINGCRVDDEEGQPVYLCIIMDITPRKQLEHEVEDIARRSEVLSAFLNETFWTYDIEKQVLSRSGNLDMTYSNEKTIMGKTWLKCLREILHPEDVECFWERLKERLQQLGETLDVYRLRNHTGDYQKVEIGCVSVSRLGGEKPDCVFGVTRVLKDSDFDRESSLKLAEQVEDLENKIMNMAKGAQAQSEDTITNLLPYNQLLQQAEEILSHRSGKEKYAVFCADITEFSKFGYQYGVSISHSILKQYAEMLQTYIAKDGLCSRIDGDYFVGLVPYLEYQELIQSLEEMCSDLDQKNIEEEQEIAYNTIVGLYLIEPGEQDLDKIMEKADLARRSIKGMKTNVFAVYTDDLLETKSREEDIIGQICRAMEEQTVEICYMPRICGNRENVIGCKAVTRIQLREGQYVESDSLQQYIERGGRLKEFAFYTLRHVCSNIGAWKALGNEVIPFAVEVTARQLARKNAVAMIDDIVVRRNKLEPSDLIFELPERYFVNMTDRLRTALEQLCDRGYQVVISRFGTDNTAVQMFRDLPVTGIKFHGEYFGGRMTDEKEKIILGGIVQMAKDLGMTVACGAVNTKLQEEYARSLGIQVMEGEMYYGAMRNTVFEKCFLS
ncbi:MAG: EAL domain-containing protein [Lachnospiraceae bacterium]|nr:EAL domain-containing protein [Lachnospiraceae bacterium]